jgi:hypothetical protein
MAAAQEKIGTYEEFREHGFPRIRDAGYGAIQIMALSEHPYYASFLFSTFIPADLSKITVFLQPREAIG